MSPTRLALQEETFQLALAEYGVGGYGLNVIASREAYDDAPDLDRGADRGDRGGIPRRVRGPARGHPGLPRPVSRAGCTVRRGELGAGVRPSGRLDRKPDRRRLADHHRDPSPAPVDRGGPRAPPPAPDNLRRVRTWPSRGRTARLPRRSGHGPGTQAELDAHLQSLETEMRAAAANLEFERAAALRDKIQALRSPGYALS